MGEHRNRSRVRASWCSAIVVSFLWLQHHAQPGTFSFNVNGSVSPAFTLALEHAGERWARVLQIDVQVKVNVYAVNLASLPFSAVTLANGRQNFQNAPVTDVLYPTALANQLANMETNPGEHDMDIYFNLATPFYYGTGKPGSSQMDFLSTAMHEIGHGLGFYSDGYVDGNGIGSFGNIPVSAIAPVTTTFPWRGQDSVPSIYDVFLETASGNPLVTCAPQHSKALGDSIRLKAVFFNGTAFANAAHNNAPIMVSGGNGFFALGQDLLHAHILNTGALMSYSWGYGDTVRAPLPFEIGMLNEIGWKPSTVALTERSPGEQISVFPNPAGTVLFVDGEDVISVCLCDLSGIPVATGYGAGEGQLAIDLARMPRGVYILKVSKSGNMTLTRKVVVE